MDPAGAEFPGIVKRCRSFRCRDEPERKQENQSFTEFHGPIKPPDSLGKIGDVYLKRDQSKSKLYLKERSGWTRWTARKDGSRRFFCHPEYPNRYLWIQNLRIDFISLSKAQHIKILNEADLLKSVASLHQTDRPSLKRKLSSSLNMKKGKKGRLSVIEAPTDHSGLSDAVTQPITPVRLTPEASSSRLPSTPVPQPPTPMSARSPQLDNELENLRQQNEAMKKKLEELKSQNSTPALLSQPVASEQPELSLDRMEDIRQPQLTPPPTPSMSEQNCNFASGETHEPLFPSMEPEESLPIAAFDELNMEEPPCRVKTEPGQARSASTSRLLKSQPSDNVIDLTFDSDEDEPQNLKQRPSSNRAELQPSTLSASRTARRSLAAACKSNAASNIASSSQSVHASSSTIGYSRSNVAGRKPNPANSAVQAATRTKPIGVASSGQSVEILPASVASATPKAAPSSSIVRSAAPQRNTAVSEKDDSDDEIMEISFDEFKGSKVSKEQTTVSPPVRSQAAEVKLEPHLKSIEDTLNEGVADSGDASEMDDMDFQLAYPDEELPPLPAPPTENTAVKMEDSEDSAQDFDFTDAIIPYVFWFKDDNTGSSEKYCRFCELVGHDIPEFSSLDVNAMLRHVASDSHNMEENWGQTLQHRLDNNDPEVDKFLQFFD